MSCFPTRMGVPIVITASVDYFRCVLKGWTELKVYTKRGEGLYGRATNSSDSGDVPPNHAVLSILDFDREQEMGMLFTGASVALKDHVLVRRGE